LRQEALNGRVSQSACSGSGPYDQHELSLRMKARVKSYRLHVRWIHVCRTVAHVANLVSYNEMWHIVITRQKNAILHIVAAGDRSNLNSFTASTLRYATKCSCIHEEIREYFDGYRHDTSSESTIRNLAELLKLFVYTATFYIILET
jgi:tRNA threonylcarbamoyladenosine modification (KEOPS) complex  Pcc1 subunit